MVAVKSALHRMLIATAVLLVPLAMALPAAAQVSIEMAIPGARIGIFQPVHPDLVPVPGYPVYYAPHARVNYFFYDGFYWVFQDERWYRSAWHDGPWDRIDPYDVPLFVLRIPVYYYVNPPVYFHGWAVSAPPRWDLYWGTRWAEHRRGWDHWDHRAVVRAASPEYQRYYSGDRYPRREHHNEVREQYYRDQPRETTLRRQPPERPAANAPVQQQPSAPARREAPHPQYPQHERHEVRGHESRGNDMRNHEVRRYATGPQVVQTAPREQLVQESFRSLVRAEDRRAPAAPVTVTPVPQVPSVQSPREDRQRPAQTSPQFRAPQAFEPRAMARHDSSPSESPRLRAPPGREHESQGRVQGRLRSPQDRGR